MSGDIVVLCSACLTVSSLCLIVHVSPQPQLYHHFLFFCWKKVLTYLWGWECAIILVTNVNFWGRSQPWYEYCPRYYTVNITQHWKCITTSNTLSLDGPLSLNTIFNQKWKVLDHDEHSFYVQLFRKLSKILMFYWYQNCISA